MGSMESFAIKFDVISPHSWSNKFSALWISTAINNNNWNKPSTMCTVHLTKWCNRMFECLNCFLNKSFMGSILLWVESSLCGPVVTHHTDYGSAPLCSRGQETLLVRMGPGPGAQKERIHNYVSEQHLLLFWRHHSERFLWCNWVDWWWRELAGVLHQITMIIGGACECLFRDWDRLLTV